MMVNEEKMFLGELSWAATNDSCFLWITIDFY